MLPLPTLSYAPTVYTHLSLNLFNPAFAPLAPQFWGELTLFFGLLPPELGGRGV
jgi:hypothetical protein